MRQHPKRWASAAALAAAALAAACTAQPSSHKSTQPAPTGSWALQSVKPAVVDPELQSQIDALPAASGSRILGVADIAGSRLVIAVRGDTCQALTLSVTGHAGTGPSAISAPRPNVADAAPKAHKEFPGNLLAGPYTQVSGVAEPYFQYVTMGCSENEIAVRLEGFDPNEGVSLKGDGARSWVEGKYLYVTIGR
ncbi:hypothetical protein Kpho02_67980 [Kitasatospora phosalacinea]|uniref:Uncharacterized protein n=1 Tax=Kitasatospora phosalacinea TaxID=2065 RepID=A0A9W6QDL6_9ACTN|nr:hypothetical protein Kpho02_67980 [Kitasatospora phosalacinea]